MVEEGQIYKHYKGNTYRILAIAKHSETLEPLVVYQDLADSAKIWARPIAMFEDTIETGAKRFTLQE